MSGRFRVCSPEKETWRVDTQIHTREIQLNVAYGCRLTPHSFFSVPLVRVRESHDSSVDEESSGDGAKLSRKFISDLK